MRACARRPLPRAGRSQSITGFTLPAAINGQTFSSTARAMARLVGDRARAQGRAGVGQALEHEAAEVDCRLRAALERDLHDPALDRRGLVVALDIVAADHVEDDVGALAAGRGLGRGDEILRPVVDGDVGAELAGRRRISPASRRWRSTRAPNALASWIAVVPMPELPPWTSSVSPALQPRRARTRCARR